MNDPAARLATCTVMSKGVSAAMSSPGAGEMMIDDTMLPCDGMSPITMPLQEPPVTCWPLVSVLPVQKFMKFASSLVFANRQWSIWRKNGGGKIYVKESACAGSSPPSWPVCDEAAWTLSGSSVNALFWSSPLFWPSPSWPFPPPFCPPPFRPPPFRPPPFRPFPPTRWLLF